MQTFPSPLVWLHSQSVAPLVCYLNSLSKRRTIFVPIVKTNRSQYLFLLRNEKIMGVSRQKRELSASPGLQEQWLGSSVINCRCMLWSRSAQFSSAFQMSGVRVIYGREEIVFADSTRWCDLEELDGCFTLFPACDPLKARIPLKDRQSQRTAQPLHSCFALFLPPAWSSSCGGRATIGIWAKSLPLGWWRFFSSRQYL